MPPDAIVPYILHYTKPGDVVFDGFCGTGMTGVAAQLCGDPSRGFQTNGGPRRAILSDLSPAATFIAAGTNAIGLFVEYLDEIEAAVRAVAARYDDVLQTAHVGWPRGTHDPDLRVLGYPFNRSPSCKLGRWITRAPACTIQDPWASSRHGSRAMRTAWTTWSGCGGPPASAARRCGHHGAWRIGDGRLMCSGCESRTSVTAGTIFDRTRTPLTVWFTACWLFATGKDTELRRHREAGSGHLGIQAKRGADGAVFAPSRHRRWGVALRADASESTPGARPEGRKDGGDCRAPEFPPVRPHGGVSRAARGVAVPMAASDFYSGLSQRFQEREGMYFLPDQVVEYDRARLTVKEAPQMEIFVVDESSAIQWLRRELSLKAQTFQSIQPRFLREIGGWQKHERALELSDLLEQNFLRYDGTSALPTDFGTSSAPTLRTIPRCVQRPRTAGMFLTQTGQATWRSCGSGRSCASSKIT